LIPGGVAAAGRAVAEGAHPDNGRFWAKVDMSPASYSVICPDSDNLSGESARCLGRTGGPQV